MKERVRPNRSIGIHSVIAAHLKHSEEKLSLNEAFGDGYLVKHNPLYRNIRQKTLDLGYNFTSKGINCYRTSPLTGLSEILKRKTIPFEANGRAFLKLRLQLVEPLPAKNVFLPTLNVLHESAHCVAHELCDKHLGAIINSRHARKSNRTVIMRIMLSEAYANACEQFGQSYAKSLVHRQLYGWNSYVQYRGSVVQNITELARVFGNEKAFKMIMLVFLYHNFLYAKIGDREVRRIITEIAGNESLTPHHIGILRSVAEESELLTESFRLIATRFYFISAGFNPNLEKILNFDFIEELSRPELAACLDELAFIATSKGSSLSTGMGYHEKPLRLRRA